MHSLIGLASIDDTPSDYLHSIGKVFALFGSKSQDSGNLSFGVEMGGDRFFVKTAGDPAAKAFLGHSERVALLLNAQRIADTYTHPALPALRHVIESPSGPLLVYDWVDGTLLGAPSAIRSDPDSAYQRFRRLPPEKIALCLDVIFEVHRDLANIGWIAVDFYDGCLIYDFDSSTLSVVDLDMYRDSPFVNEMGRMFGSTRFMAPEEFELGAVIDQRTNTYVMGRTAAVFLGNGTLDRAAFRGSSKLYGVIERACSTDPADRFQTLNEFYEAWNRARRSIPEVPPA